MSAAKRFSTVLAVLLILAAPTTWAQSAGRCIIMVDRFEDQTDLPQFMPVLDQVVAVNSLLTVDLDTSTPVSQDGLIFQLIDIANSSECNAAHGACATAECYLICRVAH